MVVANGPIRSFVAGDEPYADKAIDVEAYKNALKESGYTHEEAQKYWNDPSNADPYASLGKEIAAAVKYQVPKVSVSNGEVRIDAPKSTWDSPVVNQLKNELQVLKGVDLSNPEVTNAVNALNKELQQNWQNSMVEQTTGWTPEEYKNYQHAVQVVSRPNPLATSDYITGKKLDGKIVKMTVQDWLNYWKENLTVDQRTDAFIKSYNSNDPYERIMALIMGQGKDRPVYGFDTGDRLGQFFAATGNELAKLPIGIMRLFGTDSNTKRAESVARKASVPFSAMAKIKAVNEEVFNNKKKELDGKSWSQLNDDDKAFLILLGTSKENSSLNTAQREIMSGTKTSAGYRAEDLDRMSSEDDDISREAIKDILVENSFDNYKKAQDNFTTWYNYDEDTSQLSKRLEQNAIWSGNEQFAGSMAGTVGRYLWEAALVRAATGGISPKSITNPKLVKGTAGGVNVNAISDKIAGSWNPATKTGSGILGALGKNGISPASNFGRNVMDFTARLVGTIPEDILQTSIDNTLTYHPENNRFYDRLDEVPENLVSNFLMMAAANAAGAGWSTVRRARLAKNIEKAKVLTTKLDIPELMTADIDDFTRAAAKNQVKIDGDKVTVLDADGKEKVLKNVNGEMAEAGLRKFGIEPEEKQPWSSTTGDWNERIRLERQYIKENSPINVDTQYTEGSVGEWLKDSRTKYDADGNITVNGNDEFMRKWNELPVEVRDRILEDGNFNRLWENYEPEAVAAHMGTDFPLLPEVIDDIYADYLWKNRTNIDTEQVQVHNAETAKQRVDDVAEKVQKRLDANDVSYDAVNDLWTAIDALDRAVGYMTEDDLFRLRYNAGKLWKNIHDAGLEIQDITGRKWNDGINAEIVSVEGAPGSELYVSKVVEPAILEDGKIVRRAKVILSDKVPTAEQLEIFDRVPVSTEHKLMLDESKENAPHGYESTADYYRKAKNKEAKFVYMTPDEYLRALTKEYGGPYENFAEIIERSRTGDESDSYLKYAERMANRDFNPGSGNGKFPALSLIYDNDGRIEQEGIHRALAARRLGVEKVPVTVVYPYEGRPDVVDIILDGKEKVPDVEAPKTTDVEAPKSEMEVPKVESPEIGKIQVETETPKGTVMEEVDDYRFKGHEDALKTEIKPTRANIQRWHSRALEAVMRRFDDMMTRFHDKFGDVTVSDFDWVRHQVQQDIPESKILGSTDPSTGRVIDQNKLDAMRWYAEQPEVKDLRKASLNALTNQDSDYNILGYLPHTDYDPSNLDYDEALTGVLWKKSTGASVMQDGEYVGYGGTFQDRYRTFASNMLWDAKSPDIAASKLVEEAMLDGNELTPELVSEAKKVADGDRKILGVVDKSASTKDIIKNLSSDASDKAEWDKMQENTRKDAEKSGLGKAYHDNYTIYRGHNTKNVSSQPKSFATLSFSFDSLCNNLRKIAVEGLGTLYDNGAADMINASGNAYELTMRYAREGGSLKDMLVDYIVNHSHRSAETASEIADKWITRIGDINGDKTIGNVSIELAKCMYNEGQTRVRRFLSLAKYDQFNSATRNAIDQFLFSKMQTNAIKNSPMITKAVTKALNVATHLRYQALFYGNVKNALLQISELNRLSTTFKWGDIATMAKKMATDADFRERVDIYVDAIAPQTSRLNAELYQKYANVADGMEVKSDGVKFKDITNKMDDIGLAPINAAEAYKNRMMIAALVQEADSKGYTGDAAMRYIRQRFERVALAADEMGKIGITSNPIARVALFLQNFQIRELGMYYYNLLDEAALAKTLPGKLARQVKYLSKVLGSKLAVTLILSRLGYSASQTMGFDPFGLMDNYQKLDEDEMNELDKQISNGFLTPLFSGGMTSMIADLYFMSRKAYEDSVRETVSDEAQQNLDKPGFFDSLRFWERTKVPDNMLSFDKLMEGAQQFIPGSTAAKRIQQMNEMMDTGWATSATGNKMYTAPDDMLNTILGYLFGRSATQNAQQYNQTYGDNLWQTLGRFMPGRSWGDFDPIDSENYSDWFKGDENDAQQFNKGIYYFRDRKDEIIDAYEDAMRKSYSSSDDSEAKNDMNQRLDELFNQLEKFVSAYERKHGTITPAMTKQVLNILNTYRKNVGDTADEAAERSLEGYNRALERYSALDMPAVGTYTGPTESDATKEVKYQGSPQWRAAVNGYYSTSDEALAVLKEADKVLAPIRKQLKDSVSTAYNNNDWDALGRIQKKYLQEFDNVVGPIVASYGNGIFSDTDVVNQLRDMLSTGTNSRSANLIPSEQYAKNKYGKYQSMPYETVDVKKWAQKRFSDKIYTNPTITSNTTAAEDLSEIKKLIRRGQNDLAKARALQLKVRVDNQTRSLSSDDYKWLESYLNYKEGK